MKANNDRRKSRPALGPFHHHPYHRCVALSHLVEGWCPLGMWESSFCASSETAQSGMILIERSLAKGWQSLVHCSTTQSLYFTRISGIYYRHSPNCNANSNPSSTENAFFIATVHFNPSNRKKLFQSLLGTKAYALIRSSDNVFNVPYGRTKFRKSSTELLPGALLSNPSISRYCPTVWLSH